YEHDKQPTCCDEAKAEFHKQRANLSYSFVLCRMRLLFTADAMHLTDKKSCKQIVVLFVLS
ncbi:hypothetical protein ACT0IW_004282, partial [Escherichia coli]